MNVRQSLYRHELEIAARLAEELTALGLRHRPDMAVEVVGTVIFERLIQILYANGSVKITQDIAPWDKP